MTENEIAAVTVDAALEVHRALGPGLLETVYEATLAYELSSRGLTVARQVTLPVTYKGVRLDCGYRIDLLVEDTVIVEVKSVEALMPVHSKQLLSYLRLAGRKLGLLVNFGSALLKDGLKRVVNDL